MHQNQLSQLKAYQIFTIGNLISLTLILIYSCNQPPADQPPLNVSTNVVEPRSKQSEPIIQKPTYVIIKNNVWMKDYFTFIDQVVDSAFHSDDLLKEYLLVNANPWLIDSLRCKDYYQQKKKGILVYDDAQQMILHAGDSLLIPDSIAIDSLTHRLTSTRIDVNLPEFRLRIIQESDTLLTCRVRIGRNAKEYVEFYQREVDFQTPIGEGEIVKARRDPKFIDLQSGEEYVETKRDDGRRTKMPITPSLEPSINGKFSGTLIHATTNPKSLGKASSHGCVGTSEPDIWSIYYYCPPGTKVNFRYDLEVIDKQGKTIHLKDVYQLYEQ